MINDIKEGNSVKIPVFDKSMHNGQGDRSHYKEIPSSKDYDYCIFEGWFNGLPALPEQYMAHATVS